MEFFENMTLLSKFFPAAYKVTREKAFVVVFGDLMQWQYMYDLAVKSGFAVQRWPIIWRKVNQSVMNNCAMYNTTKDYEIILVCRKRPLNAPTISRREFLRELNTILPSALDEMTKGSGDDRSPVAPVDLSQAIIGPGKGGEDWLATSAEAFVGISFSPVLAPLTWWHLLPPRSVESCVLMSCSRGSLVRQATGNGDGSNDARLQRPAHW